MEQFLKVVNEEDFSTLTGEDENPVISDLTNHPNSFWLHPNLFLSEAGPTTIRAADMASIVLLSIQESSSGDDELPSEDELGIYNLLIFLCAVEKCFTLLVGIQDQNDD
jgi:hypothetical protein